MTYAEAFRTIEQMRPRGLWSLLVETTVVASIPVTRWELYVTGHETITCRGAADLVEAARHLLSPQVDTVDDVGEVA